MSAPFQVGDLCVCIDVTQPVNKAFPPIETLMKLRGIYRVSERHETRNCGVLIGIVGIPRWVWHSDRFRPLVAADAEFAATIAALKPNRVPA